MRIIYVEDYFDSEAGYQINEMLKIKTKNEIFLICTKDMGPFHKVYNKLQEEKDREFENRFNIKIIRLDIAFKIGGRVIYQDLIKEIRKIEPNVLFLHGIGDFKDAYFLLLKKKNYLIFRDCHMSWVASRNKFAKLYYRFFANTFAKIINNSLKYEKIYSLGSEETEYLTAIGIKKQRIEMLPHGYNKNIYFQSDELRKKVRNELELKEKTILISYVGKFDSYKKPHIALEIYQELGKNFIEKMDLKFLFLGPKDDNYMENFFYPILEKMNFKDRIIILPGRKSEELNEIYNASDICIWPQETTLSSIHAQATGRVCIMENHTSNQERVIDDENLYEIGNIASGVKKLKQVIEKNEYKKDNIKRYEDFLSKREYHYQIENLYNNWEKLLK